MRKRGPQQDFAFAKTASKTMVIGKILKGMTCF